MTILAFVSLVSLLGWLALNVSGLRAMDERPGRLFKLALLWIALFVGAFAIFSYVTA